MRILKIVLIALAGLVGVFAATTWWALESGGVAVVETRTHDGSLRSTHVWFVEPDGGLWIEAGTPQNPWFLDVQRHPVLSFRADGSTGRYAARAIATPAAHDRIRGLLREKYGFRDVWVGLLVDTSGSVAVELTPADDEGRGGPGAAAARARGVSLGADLHDAWLPLLGLGDLQREHTVAESRFDAIRLRIRR